MEAKELLKCIVGFIATTPRKSQFRIWKQKERYYIRIPEEEAAQIRGWGPEDLYVEVFRLEKVAGEAFRIEIPGKPTVEREKV